MLEFVQAAAGKYADEFTSARFQARDFFRPLEVGPQLFEFALDYVHEGMADIMDIGPRAAIFLLAEGVCQYHQVAYLRD